MHMVRLKATGGREEKGSRIEIANQNCCTMLWRIVKKPATDQKDLTYWNWQHENYKLNTIYFVRLVIGKFLMT